MTTASPLEVGCILEGTVTGITRFGAFIALPGGHMGLVHISEVADAFVRDVHEHLVEQQLVRVKILSIDQQGKVALSIKQADPAAQGRQRRPEPRWGTSFEDRLTRFLKDSDEKLTTLKRSTDSKRGGRGTRR